MSRLLVATLACGSVGFVIMLVFDGPLARSVGMAALLGFVLTLFTHTNNINNNFTFW